MKKNNSYPLPLVRAYKAGEITRQQFINEFSNWQKSNGINFGCKGTADENGVYITYRGIRAEIRNGTLHFFSDGRKTAQSVFEFRRKVDFSLNRRNPWN